MYRVTFSISEKRIYEVLARSVDDESHPYLIYISELEFEDKSNLIISPNGDEARKRFGEVDEIIIPVQGLRLIEKIPDHNERVTSLKIMTDKE